MKSEFYAEYTEDRLFLPWQDHKTNRRLPWWSRGYPFLINSATAKIERAKNCDDNELNKIIIDNFKDPINSIYSNQLFKGIEGQFGFRRSILIEEDKH